MGAGETSRQKPASRAQAANGGADEGRYPTKKFKDFVARPSSATSLLKLDNIDFIPKCFVDVGANQGDWTREYLRYYPDASFFMIDANREQKAKWARNGVPKKSTKGERAWGAAQYQPINLDAQPNVQICVKIDPARRALAPPSEYPRGTPRRRRDPPSDYPRGTPRRRRDPPSEYPPHRCRRTWGFSTPGRRTSTGG